MALYLGHLLNGASSSESETEVNGEPLSTYDKELGPKIKYKLKGAEDLACESIRLNHHLKMAKEAVKSKKPPRGLTPTLKLTAYLGTTELSHNVDQLLISCGVDICATLQKHYSKLLKDNKEKIAQLYQEINTLVDSAENTTYRATLTEKVKKANDSITAGCEKQASQLAEKAS